MSRATRTMLRIAAAMAIAIGTLLVASPAQAHPVVSGPHCDAGSGYISCIIGMRGEVRPVDIKWTFNGVHHRQCDDDQWCSSSCPVGSVANVRVVVTDASGVPVSRGKPYYCGKHIP